MTGSRRPDAAGREDRFRRWHVGAVGRIDLDPERASCLRCCGPEFTLLGGMMVDRTDIGHLLSTMRSMKIAAARREAAGAIWSRPAEPFAGLPAGDGQRPGRPSVVFIAPPRCGDFDGHVVRKNCPKRADEFQERAVATVFRDHGLLTNPIMV